MPGQVGFSRFRNSIGSMTNALWPHPTRKPRLTLSVPSPWKAALSPLAKFSMGSNKRDSRPSSILPWNFFSMVLARERPYLFSYASLMQATFDWRVGQAREAKQDRGKRAGIPVSSWMRGALHKHCGGWEMGRYHHIYEFVHDFIRADS